MSMTDSDTSPRPAARHETESSKRRDILDGARRVFFDKGFDGASMDEVARAASVSKATIYVYFPSKEELFEALVHTDRARSAELLFEIDRDNEDVESQLRRIGVSFMTMMVQPDHIRLVRMVIGVAEKFPNIGKAFYNTGPCNGGRRLADLLRQHADRGHLVLDDEIAAAHLFFNMCQSSITKGLLFGETQQPAPEQIQQTVDRAVRVFLAAYGPHKPD
ncbi:TetR/AcrR family transcriptional regulator [Ancylobacter sp. 6x-1]|uniref:TetR/AcrR family transcriptional regulator n=1 Tax=Ancylobacter crimeensis TaxID=2579147 RepID=A0ABT0DA49_9HYPH|nr:TetR/AcrR family transcriptional regulator [Ancylobacter crimeensis]MCK0196831.1 TetR/AcrR family transcriptional regulator [Ancylobacter crimeensis]